MDERICANCQYWAEKPNRFEGIGDGLNIRVGRCLVNLHPVNWGAWRDKMGCAGQGRTRNL